MLAVATVSCETRRRAALSNALRAGLPEIASSVASEGSSVSIRHIVLVHDISQSSSSINDGTNGA